MTIWAGAERGIEAEGTRFELRHRYSAVWAGQLFRKHQLIAAHHRHRHQAVGQLQRGFNRLFQPGGNSAFQQQAIDHDFDGVIPAPVQWDRLIDIHQLAVDARPKESLLGVFLQVFLIFALAATDHRRENHHPIVWPQPQHRLHDLLGRLALDGLAAVRAVRRADGGVDHPQVVVDFGDGPHRRARRPGGGLLLDSD